MSIAEVLSFHSGAKLAVLLYQSACLNKTPFPYPCVEVCSQSVVE